MLQLRFILPVFSQVEPGLKQLESLRDEAHELFQEATGLIESSAQRPHCSRDHETIDELRSWIKKEFLVQHVELQQLSVSQQSLEYNLKRLQQGPLGMSASTSSQGVCTSMEEFEKHGRSLLVSRSRGASADDMLEGSPT